MTKDSNTKNYKSDYVDLLVSFIEHIVYSFDKDSEDAIITLKETLKEDVEKNHSDIIEAIHIVKSNLEPNNSAYNGRLNSLEGFKKYVDSF